MSLSVNRGWIVDIVQHLPAGVLSRAWGFIVRRRRPRFAVDALKRTFAGKVGIDLAEAAAPMEAYDCLESMFVRRLKPGARRTDPAPEAVVSPVDGLVGACGEVENGTLFQVKGRAYSLARLLDDPEEAARYEGGPYATLYLSPRDYHRIHSPLDGEVREARIVPGALMPVFQESLEKIEELFARNERLITYLDTRDCGRVAVVKVGATLVGRIGVSYDPKARTNRRGARPETLRYDPPHLMPKGADLGVFELGSTVVLVGQRGKLSFDRLTPASPVQVGARIGTILARVSEAQGRGAAEHTATDAPPASDAPGGVRRP